MKSSSWISIVLVVVMYWGCDANKGYRGELCQRGEDCQSGLYCDGVCRQDVKNLTDTGAYCVAVRCEDDSMCNNNEACIDDVCQSVCQDDAWCPGVCVSGVCRDCSNDSHCALDELCVEDELECYRECRDSESCPVFYSCNNGLCEHDGCSDDTECIFALGSFTAVCSGGQCMEGCETDFHCGTGASVCSGGVCVSAGCEDETDCKAMLFPDGLPSQVIGLECRDIEDEGAPFYADAYPQGTSSSSSGSSGFTSCTDAQWTCSSGGSITCIPLSYLCDGDPDCPDGSDEGEFCLY